MISHTRKVAQHMELDGSEQKYKTDAKLTNTLLSKYNSASEMFVKLNISPFDELLRKFAFSFRSRLQDSGDSL